MPSVRDDQYVLNNCTVYLARLNKDARHDFGFGHYMEGDDRGRVRDAWRFPIIDTCAEAPPNRDTFDFNDVTFIYPVFNSPPREVSVIGTFSNLYEPIRLRRIKFLGEDTAYFAATLAVPKRGIFLYKFLVDGQVTIDPINPQRCTVDNGAQWSRFFTWECSEPVAFESWELRLVQRLCNHILPFRTKEAQRFLSWYYNGLDIEARRGLQRRAYRFDDSVGAAVYIDHILAREERHHFNDYRKCLKQIFRLLRERDPAHEPHDASMEFFIELYNELAANRVQGWHYDDYASPRYFLDLLRRHAFTGAFSHPKYGGNAATAGWAYLDTELTPQGESIFDWRSSLERPLGRSEHYIG